MYKFFSNVKIWFAISMMFLMTTSSLLNAQAPQDWFLKEYQVDKVYGVGAEKAYELLTGQKSVPVVVAVIDGGVEADHADLKNIMWVNKNEIPGNGKDDDKNGYIDDIHGWNFIGNKDGNNVHQDSYEVTRFYAANKARFEGKEEQNISSKDQADYKKYLEAKEKVKTSKEYAQSNLDQITQTKKMIIGPLDAVAKKLGSKPITKENIEAIDAGDDTELMMGVMIMQQFLSSEEIPTHNIDTLKMFVTDELDQAEKHYSNEVNYAYNPDFNPRTIIGDSENNYSERNYGNNDVEGPDGSHGTHVAGIIGADRKNNIGIKGIADNVQIMSVRAVPDGDERDKDVANAIRYAVDNGAKVINMSFGKGISPGKKYVDEAVKYASDHDVLLIHAAGNSTQNNDSIDSYPNARYIAPIKKKSIADNWIEVGALDYKGFPASFSNYGEKNVDIFAPGVDIYSTVPDQKYQSNSGTSMAAPAVSGVAALLRSYFPELSAIQIKEAIMKSAQKMDQKVPHPKTQQLVDFKNLSVSGGYIDAFEAVKVAAKMTKKNLKSLHP